MNPCSRPYRWLRRAHVTRFATVLALGCGLTAVPVHGQTFSSGSDGSDGVFAPTGSPGTIIQFDPSQFHGSQVAANIFNFTSVSIPDGVTVRISRDKVNGPVYWLVQGDVFIRGVIDISGGPGHDVTTNPFGRVPATPGSGGYPGGTGGSGIYAAMPGGGPGGGAAGVCGPSFPSFFGKGGTFSGNSFLVPLIGGSGGGGSSVGDCTSNVIDGGGGAGGGGIEIASSGTIFLLGSGQINAQGGAGTGSAGGGSGGAVRLVANLIRNTFGSESCGGSCFVTVSGGSGAGGGTNGGPGVIRLEAPRVDAPHTAGTLIESGPFALNLPTAGPATAQVISIGGVSINPNPSIFPDITINTASAVPVVIQTHNIPVTATITLTILNENGVPDAVIPAPPLGNCDQNNSCTTTVSVVFPFGASRGLTKVSWTQ
jgi:hypothetical protein